MCQLTRWSAVEMISLQKDHSKVVSDQLVRRFDISTADCSSRDEPA